VGLLARSLPNSAPGISQSLRATGIAPAVSSRTLWNSHVDATTLFGRCQHAGLSELVEAYVENIIGVDRRR
jgi:hypothetical protein